MRCGSVFIADRIAPGAGRPHSRIRAARGRTRAIAWALRERGRAAGLFARRFCCCLPLFARVKVILWVLYNNQRVTSIKSSATSVPLPVVVLSVSAATLDGVTTDDRDVDRLLACQRGVVSTAQASAIGLTVAGLKHRYRPGGPWQRLLPRVYLMSTGEPTGEQLQTAALLTRDRRA